MSSGWSVGARPVEWVVGIVLASWGDPMHQREPGFVGDSLLLLSAYRITEECCL